MKKQNIYYVISCAFLIFTIFYLMERREEKEIPPTKDIISFPREVKGFNGKDINPSYADFYGSAADSWILRAYTKNGDDRPIGIFIGYWERQDEIKKIKPPRYLNEQGSYTGIKTKSFKSGSMSISLKEFLNEKKHGKELIYYCYVIDKKIISSEYYFRYLNMRNKLLYGRNNAALLSFSMSVTDDWPVEKAEFYQEKFITDVLSILLQYI